MGYQTERAGPRGDAETGSQNAACLAACNILNATQAESGQEDQPSRCASPEAIAAARDLAFEGLCEAGSLAESYSRCLAEAAWRGDQLTVEAHLRQLRACLIAGIGMFKQLTDMQTKGGLS